MQAFFIQKNRPLFLAYGHAKARPYSADAS